MPNEKRLMTSIGKIDILEDTYKNLLLGKELSYDESSLLLSCAIILLNDYDKDSNNKMFFEMAYEIIARYSLSSGDYKPLYDFSINYGFFPIVDYISKNNQEFIEKITDIINGVFVDKYRTDSFMPTVQQHHAYEGVLKEKNKDISFIAPTSFGKSGLIISHIKKVDNSTSKVGIIVPTKSLLMQTYRYVKDEIANKKILLHDQMYLGEASYIAVLTQERALRLLEKHNTYFDYLYIDEAHNLFDNDSRNRLLARLIRLARVKNNECEVLYFSPLVDTSDNLRVLGASFVSEYRIDNNIKIPTYYLYDNMNSYIYNRFFNKLYSLDECHETAYKYITDKSTNKNLLYINAPKRMENVTMKFAAELPNLNSPAIKQIIASVKKHVHKDFQMIPLIQKGIVYLHGKLPDYVKDYIEYKAATTDDIRYISANAVLLEGINLPITSLFILDARGLKTNKLINLCGRVNRLNSIFGENPKISKLFPPIHFVSNEDFSGVMKNYLERLRANDITDEIENPFLENYDITSTKDEKREQIEKILDEENIYFSNSTSEEEELYKKMLSLSMNAHLELNIIDIRKILNKIITNRDSLLFKEKSIVEKVVEIFLEDLTVIDFELARLTNKHAIDYYQHYLTVMRKRSLQQNIKYEYEYFVKRKNSADPYIFMGSSYGECYRPIDEQKKYFYVNLKNKEEAELVNLAIIKLKMEDDFLSYKFNKFVELLHDYQLISDEEYNLSTYGTNNEMEIKLIKQGLPIHIVSKLTNDEQLKNLWFDENNIVYSNDNFNAYYETLDDFYQYQVGKYISI